MNKRIKISAITTFIFTAVFFLIPQQAHGFVLDLAQTQLAALSERTGPVAAVFFSAFLFFSLGYIVLYLAASLLQGIIAITPVVLSVTAGGASDFVRIGWSFTAGIVNLIMIIAFIVIAFAVILGSEKIQLKKALPKLIMVALFVNFTLLFVGVGIDASNFLFNTVANQFLAETTGGGNVFFNSLTPLFDLSKGQILATTLYLTGSAMGLLLPYVNVLMQVAWVVGIPWLFSSVVQFIVYGAIMWGLASLFLLYFFIFVIRIFIIQVLAVLAPLAFFCLIFDETKKYWDQWLSHLVQWLFVGVIFIFLMYFGLAMAPIVMTMADPFANLFFPGATPDDLNWFVRELMSILGYIILLSYFMVILFIGKKFVPAAADIAISQAKEIKKSATPWVGAIGKGAGARMRNKELERSKKIKERESTGRGGLGTTAMKTQSWMIRRAHNITGTSVEQERKKDIESKVEVMKKVHGDDYEDAISAFKIGIKADTDKMALLQYLSGGGAKALTKLDNKQIGSLIELAGKRDDSKSVKNAIKHIPDRGDVLAYENKLKELEETVKDPNISPDELNNTLKEIKKAKNDLDAAIKIQSAMISDIKKASPKVKELENELVEAQEELKTAISNNEELAISTAKKKIEKLQTSIKTASGEAINKISVQSLKPQEIENLSDGTLENKGFLKALVENKNMTIMKAIEERNDGPKVIKDITEIIKKNEITTKDGKIIKGIAALKETNSTLYNQIRKSAAGQAVFSDIHDEIQAEENSSKSKNRETQRGEVRRQKNRRR